MIEKIPQFFTTPKILPCSEKKKQYKIQLKCLLIHFQSWLWNTLHNSFVYVYQIQTPSSNNTREDSTHGHHQLVNTEIGLIIFSEAKDGEAVYSQQKQDQELTVAQIMKSLSPNSDLNWRK